MGIRFDMIVVTGLCKALFAPQEELGCGDALAEEVHGCRSRKRRGKEEGRFQRVTFAFIMNII